MAEVADDRSVSTDAPNRNELADILGKLLRLLHSDNYHPGLMGWQDMYRRRVEELLTFYGHDYRKNC
jgi:hypothetical protein